MGYFNIRYFIELIAISLAITITFVVTPTRIIIGNYGDNFGFKMTMLLIGWFILWKDSIVLHEIIDRLKSKIKK